MYIHDPKLWNPHIINSRLGKWTDEEPDCKITRFRGLGPNNYAYMKKTKDGKVENKCKVKGITLDYKTNQIVNFDLYSKCAQDRSTGIEIRYDCRIKRNKDRTVISEPQTKMFRSVYSKYAMMDFISMMINEINLDPEHEIYLPIQTSDRWAFILFGRTEESFLNVLKMKSVLFNFYIRYEKGSIQDEEETLEILKGYILFDRDVTKNIVLSALITKNVEKRVDPLYGYSYLSEMDSTYTQSLGNEKLHQNFFEHEEKWKNRGICEFAL